ncbi:MAG: hypothetical protein JJE22_06720, partial [Bacteroidia bacterium]|nr:hypothetical protein [Bacteroidia bacterium]
PFIFIIISVACFSFLYFNIHASLKQQTFSNLDHYFIRHDGFNVTHNIELGRSDTTNHRGNAFNRFVFDKQNDHITVSSLYSEEPFYVSESGAYKLLSATYPSLAHAVSFRVDSVTVIIRTASDSSFQLTIGSESVLIVSKMIRKGLSAWNVFKDDESFINSSWYTNEKLINALKNILLLRDNVSRRENGELKYFLSGRLFQNVLFVKYDENILTRNGLAFKAAIADNSIIAWGIGFLDNNRNQFRINNRGSEGFSIMNRYPVSYPLSEENSEDWSPHGINKFLVSDSKDILNMPPVFREGFLFSAFDADNSIDFSPVLLSYHKASGDDPVKLKARFLDIPHLEIRQLYNQLILPARKAGFSWIFSLQNTFEWNFGSSTLSGSTWQGLLFGSLLFFFIMIFFSSWLKPADKLSWVWQLLSCITIVLLTTRFFLYWRYKSFPPYEGMDLPSQQQLQGFWNFGIIILATILLAVIFGFSFLKYLYRFIAKQSATLLNKKYKGYEGNEFFNYGKVNVALRKTFFIYRIGIKAFF